MDCWSGSLRRLTDTPEEEKCARFSPDGLLVSFVRQNDLFVHDLDAGVERRLTEDGSETTLNGTLSWLYWEEIQGRRDEGTFWSGDSRSLAYLQTDESGVPVPRNPRFGGWASRRSGRTMTETRARHEFLRPRLQCRRVG